MYGKCSLSRHQTYKATRQEIKKNSEKKQDWDNQFSFFVWKWLFSAILKAYQHFKKNKDIIWNSFKHIYFHHMALSMSGKKGKYCNVILKGNL